MSRPEIIRIVHRGGATRDCLWHDWLAADSGALKSMVRLHLGGLGGVGTFSLAHGWGSKPLGDWRLHPDDLAALRVWAEQEEGRKIAVVPRSPGRRVQPKRGKKVHPRQEKLFE